MLLTVPADRVVPKSSFRVWLVVFYAAWLTLVIAGSFGDVLAAHWPIALTMLLGSYVAGSTPMGGGTVAFPVLVLAFDYPGPMGRHFALAIQSIGMVSASIFILSRNMPLAWPVLRPALCGAVVGTIGGLAFVAPFVSDVWTKLLFAVIWCSFGILHLLRMSTPLAAEGICACDRGTNRMWGLIVGITGGVAASITGVGIDMILYAVLVLRYRSDLRIAIPTSVILMAATSLIGISTALVLRQTGDPAYAIHPDVFRNWIAAAPIVAVGAPIGAWVVSHISRRPTLLIVSALCLGQFVWTVFRERLSGGQILVASCSTAAITAAFLLLDRRFSDRRSGAPEREDAMAGLPEIADGSA